MANPVGAPLKYKTPEDLKAAIDKYFSEMSPLYYTVTGLALALDFSSRQSIYEYAEKPEFGDLIKKALLRIENGYELKLGESKIPPAGTIFVLKNMGWKDKQETEHSGGLSVTRIELPPKADVGAPVEL